jgi:hypothetical protein
MTDINDDYRRIIYEYLDNLPVGSRGFVLEFIKDFSARRAAEASGMHPDEGVELLKDPEVDATLQCILEQRLRHSHITADWVLLELADNHRIARQRGQISASNTALKLIAQHTNVDAFAAQKVDLTDSQSIIDRIKRGRERVAAAAPDVPDFFGGPPGGSTVNQ